MEVFSVALIDQTNKTIKPQTQLTLSFNILCYSIQIARFANDNLFDNLYNNLDLCY